MKGWLFVNVLTYGGALVSLWNPFVGLCIYICFGIIRPENMWQWSVEPGAYSRLIGIALLAGWLLRGFGNWQFGRGWLVIWALLGFWFWGTLSAYAGGNYGYAFFALEAQAKVFLPFLVGCTVIDSVRKIKIVAWVIVASQGYVAYILNERYYSGFSWLLHESGFGYMDNNCIAIAMVAGIGLAFFLAVHAATIWEKAAAFVFAMLMIHVIMFSASRSSLLALIVTGGIIFILIPKKIEHYLFFVVVLALGWRLAGEGVIQRFLTSFVDAQERDASAQSRLDIWAQAWDTMLRYPILGVGTGQWAIKMAPQYGWNVGKQIHSMWLTIGSENGFPGLIFLATFFLGCVKRLWPLCRERTYVADPVYRGFARMIVASTLGFCFAAQFVSIQGLEVPYYVIMLGVVVLKQTSVPGAVAAPGTYAPAAYAYPSFPAPTYRWGA